MNTTTKCYLTNVPITLVLSILSLEANTDCCTNMYSGWWVGGCDLHLVFSTDIPAAREVLELLPQLGGPYRAYRRWGCTGKELAIQLNTKQVGK